LTTPHLHEAAVNENEVLDEEDLDLEFLSEGYFYCGGERA
jgi:hypothetical protein